MHSPEGSMSTGQYMLTVQAFAVQLVEQNL